MTNQQRPDYRISRRQAARTEMANPPGRLPGARRWLLAVCVLLSLVAGASEARAAGRGPAFDTLDELAAVLNVVRAPVGKLRHHAPPDYLRHLYHSTTDADGFPRGPAPHRADTIYGYLSAAPRPGLSMFNFIYNVSQLDSGTQLLSSDLHVFRMHRWRRRTRVKRVATRRTSPFLILKLYKVLDPARRRTPYGNKLIDVKRVVSHHHGWIVFNAQQAVKDWVRHGQDSNYGFLITAQTSDGRFVNPSTLQFAQRFEHHDRLQPLLAVYTNHTRRRATEDTPYSTALTQAFDSNDPQRFAKIYGGNFYVPPPRVRNRRDTEAALRDSEGRDRQRRDPDGWGRNRRVSATQGFCGKRTMYVNFTTLGWDEWVVSPKGYNAYSCQGACPYPLSQTSDPTNHAIVLSLVYNSKTQHNLEGPCCVPKKLQSLTLLYYDTKYRVVLRPFHGMSVVSCGCQ